MPQRDTNGEARNGLPIRASGLGADANDALIRDIDAVPVHADAHDIGIREFGVIAVRTEG